MLQVGDKAPDFELLSSAEEKVKLSDFRGQRVILFFFPKAATPGCTTQACGFRDNMPTIEDANATVIGVSPDDPPALMRWKYKQNLPFTLLSDPEHEVAETYGVWGQKTMFGNTFTGVIRSHFVIDEDGNIADKQVKISPNKSVEKAVGFVKE